MNRLQGEDGSALALALAFLSLFGVLIAAVLGFSETGLRSSRALSSQGDELAAAAGAIEGAIQRLREDLDAGVAGTDEVCFSPPRVNGTQATVRCEGQPGSGVVTGGGADPGTMPEQAILTLGTGAGGEDGLVKGVGGSTFDVGGDVFSDSTIDVTGTLAVAGQVQALGNCTGTITASQVRCANTGGGADAAAGADPGYLPEVASRPPTRTAPSCDGGWLLTFQPGTYTDAAALTSMMNGTGACAGDVFWFQPGVYYFEFAGASRVWQIKDQNATVIGGTPKDWSPSDGSRPAIGVPGGCDTSGPGVQFIVGGDSQIDISSGAVELCPDPHDDRQRIAVYGLSDAVVGAGTATLTPAAASSASFAPAADARVIDGATAATTIPETNPGSSRTITLSSFGGIPAGALITAATLRVAHREDPISAPPRVASITVEVQPASGPPVLASLAARSTLGTDEVDLLATGLSPTADATGFTVAYTVTARNNRSTTAFLDGVELVLEYASSAMTPQSGCATATPYPGSGRCAFLSLSGNNSNLITHGTIYAPTGAIDASLPTTARRMFRRGLIARTVQVHVPTVWSQGTPAVSIPSGAGGTRADRLVLLTSRIDGVARVRALVRITDGGGSTPGASVTIEEWSVR